MKPLLFLTGYDMEKIKYTKEDAIKLLQDKSATLDSVGDARFPKRSDFTDSEVEAIKAHLGPWPRALEAAGLKEPRSVDRLEKNREKRRRAKIRQREAKLSKDEKTDN